MLVGQPLRARPRARRLAPAARSASSRSTIACSRFSSSARRHCATLPSEATSHSGSPRNRPSASRSSAPARLGLRPRLLDERIEAPDVELEGPGLQRISGRLEDEQPARAGRGAWTDARAEPRPHWRADSRPTAHRSAGHVTAVRRRRAAATPAASADGHWAVAPPVHPAPARAGRAPRSGTGHQSPRRTIRPPASEQGVALELLWRAFGDGAQDGTHDINPFPQRGGKAI